MCESSNEGAVGELKAIHDRHANCANWSLQKYRESKYVSNWITMTGLVLLYSVSPHAPPFRPYFFCPGLPCHTPAKAARSAGQQWGAIEPRPAHVEKWSPLVIASNGYTSPRLLFISSKKRSSWMAKSFSSLSYETLFGGKAIAGLGSLFSSSLGKNTLQQLWSFKTTVQITDSPPFLFV